VTVLNLSRNFGKEIAITAGIFHASGDAVIILDADGQHPPKLLPKFIEKWQDGAQVVVGVRASNQDEGLIKKYGSKLFYRLFNSASGASIVPRSTDFRLLDRAVVEEFKACSERNRITRGLIDWLGFERSYIEFNSPARIAGTASYSTSQLIKLALDSFVSLSLRPLEILSSTGFVITSLAFITGLGVFIEQIVLSDPLNLNITGSAMLGLFITFLVGLVITSQGIIATYLAHIHTQTQSRPLFIVNKKGSVNLNVKKTSQ
jgi:dolichol-phosphate mannosyltransferase